MERFLACFVLENIEQTLENAEENQAEETLVAGALLLVHRLCSACSQSWVPLFMPVCMRFLLSTTCYCSLLRV